jgi:hypothetical protein
MGAFPTAQLEFSRYPPNRRKATDTTEAHKGFFESCALGHPEYSCPRVVPFCVSGANQGSFALSLCQRTVSDTEKQPAVTTFLIEYGR